MLTEYVKGIHTSVIGFLFWLLQFVVAVFKLASGVSKLVLDVSVFNTNQCPHLISFLEIGITRVLFNFAFF